MLLQRNASESWSRSNNKNIVEGLEREIDKAKESERKMLESLCSQTKQLEETKISLEEAKLEIRSLEASIRTFEASASLRTKGLEKHHSFGSVRGTGDDISALKTELKLAIEAEEKSKEAMDGLAMALKEVTTEANLVKENLSRTQSLLKTSQSEAQCLKTLLKSTEEKLWLALEDSKRHKIESEEASTAWNHKENGFINFMKMNEEEVANIKHENDRLIDALRSAREESSRLRDIMKQAVNEANVVKEALEIARNENSQLKDTLAEKENALQSIKQEYECLKVSEAAALDSVKELSSLLTATSSLGSSTTSLIGIERNSGKRLAKFPSENWRGGDNLRLRNERAHSFEESGRFEGSIFDMAWSPRKERNPSVGSGERTCSLMGKEGKETLSCEELGSFSRVPFGDLEHDEGSPSRQKKRRPPSLRRIGDMLRRSFHK